MVNALKDSEKAGVSSAELNKETQDEQIKKIREDLEELATSLPLTTPWRRSSTKVLHFDFKQFVFNHEAPKVPVINNNQRHARSGFTDEEREARLEHDAQTTNRIRVQAGQNKLYKRARVMSCMLLIII